MNVTIVSAQGWESQPYPDPVADVDDHVLSMKSAGYYITERHVLVPEGPDYPGSYQIWLQIQRAYGVLRWVYVDAEGVMHERINPGEAEDHG